jgi:site-specific recombinase XerD
MTMPSLLLLLYGTAMRTAEALSLTLQNVDLEERLLTVRDTKFYKTRLVPIGPRLTMILADCLSCRRRLPLPDGEASACLATGTGVRLDYKRVNKLFCRLRKVAEVARETPARSIAMRKSKSKLMSKISPLTSAPPMGTVRKTACITPYPSRNRCFCAPPSAAHTWAR